MAKFNRIATTVLEKDDDDIAYRYYLYLPTCIYLPVSTYLYIATCIYREHYGTCFRGHFHNGINTHIASASKTRDCRLCALSVCHILLLHFFYKVSRPKPKKKQYQLFVPSCKYVQHYNNMFWKRHLLTITGILLVQEWS